MKIFKANRRAFTLLEMILILAIIAIISGVFWANYYGGESRSQLINAQRGLIKNLRLAQTYSLSGKQYSGNLPVGGWGVHIDIATTTYLFFADVDGNQVYDVGEASTAYGGRSEVLPTGVAFESIAPADIVDITFSVSGTPRANIYDGASTSSEATIVFTESENETNSTVRVGESGLISDQ